MLTLHNIRITVRKNKLRVSESAQQRLAVVGWKDCDELFKLTVNTPLQDLSIYSTDDFDNAIEHLNQILHMAGMTMEKKA